MRNIRYMAVRISAMLLIMAGFVIGANAQQGEPTIRENFELEIRNETITETDFRRSTNISVESGELKVEAGAAVSAGRITVRLVNITGRVRFFASAASLTDLLRRRTVR